jgi:hypothetical protein
MHQINVYDLRWNYVGRFWSGSDFGLTNLGDFVVNRTDWSRPVYLKRVS